MKKEIEKAVKLLIENLSAEFSDFYGIYLCGSYAEPDEEDDIELVAIFDKEDKEKREIIWRIVGKVEEKTNLYIDLNPVSKHAFENDKEYFDDVVKYGKYFTA